jgi:hypothetical protein
MQCLATCTTDADTPTNNFVPHPTDETKCVKQDTEITGYVINTDKTAFIKCLDNCNECTAATATTACTTCNPVGYVINTVSKLCSKCPDGCSECTSDSGDPEVLTCTACTDSDFNEVDTTATPHRCKVKC